MQLAGSCGRCPRPLSRFWCSRPEGGHTPAGFACSHGQADAQPSTRSSGKRSRGSRMLTGDRRFGDPPTQLSWQLSARQSCSPQSGQTGCEGSGKRTARTLDQTVHANSREHRDSDWLSFATKSAGSIDDLYSQSDIKRARILCLLDESLKIFGLIAKTVPLPDQSGVLTTQRSILIRHGVVRNSGMWWVGR
jgi:hypothetical protein